MNSRRSLRESVPWPPRERDSLSREPLVTALPEHDDPTKLTNEFGTFFVKKKKFKGNLDKLQVQEPRLPPATPKENQENFSSLSIEEVCKIVLESSNASCRVDPVPTWLVKSCLDVLAPSISLSSQWWRSRKLEKRCCHPSIEKTWTGFGLQKFPSN